MAPFSSSQLGQVLPRPSSHSCWYCGLASSSAGHHRLWAYAVRAMSVHSTHSTPAFTTLLPLLLALSLSAPSSMVFLRLRGHGSVIYVPFRVPDLNLMQQLGDLVRLVFWKCSFRLQTDKVKWSPLTDTKVQFYLLIILTYMLFKKYYLGTICLLLRELIHFTYTLSIYGSVDTIFEKLAS